MFGVDFSELMVIMVVALIVIGPERLPKVARTAGHLWGRAHRYINGIKSDIARDMAAEEFKALQLKVQQEVMAAEAAAKNAGIEMNAQAQALNSAVVQSADAISQAAGAPAAPEQSRLDLQAPSQDKTEPTR